MPALGQKKCNITSCNRFSYIFCEICRKSICKNHQKICRVCGHIVCAKCVAQVSEIECVNCVDIITQ